MGAEDGRIIPRSLYIKLCDVVELVHEGVCSALGLLLLNIPVAKLISNHILLADTKGSDVVGKLGLIVLGRSQVEKLPGSVGALCTNLVHIFDILASTSRISVCVGGLR